MNRIQTTASGLPCPIAARRLRLARVDLQRAAAVALAALAVRDHATAHRYLRRCERIVRRLVALAGSDAARPSRLP
jgi:hypothetical protein